MGIVAMLALCSVVSVFGFVGFGPGKASATVPGVNEVVSLTDTGAQSSGGQSVDMAISGDGRYVAFQSSATNLVSGDTNSADDIFLRDRTSNTLTRISVSSSGAQSNGYSSVPRISNDGRYVVFASTATNLTSDTVSSALHIYMHDNQTGTTTLVSKSASGTPSDQADEYPDVSADGRYVVFDSDATNLVSGVSAYGIGAQIYLKDMVTGAIQALSLNGSGAQANGASLRPRIDCDGGIVAFESDATNLAAGDTNGARDVFLSQVGWSGNKLTEISLGGNSQSDHVDVSCNGNDIVYSSSATNLASNATASSSNYIFEYNRLSQTNVLASEDNSGSAVNGVDSNWPAISDDGRYVVFQSIGQFDSYGGNTGSGSNDNIFIRDMKGQTTQSISRNSTYLTGNSTAPDISADGSYVAYDHQESWSSPYGQIITADTNNLTDVYVSQTGF